MKISNMKYLQTKIMITVFILTGEGERDLLKNGHKNHPISFANKCNQNIYLPGLRYSKVLNNDHNNNYYHKNQ